MKINITARSSNVTQITKEYAQEKAEKLKKFNKLLKIDIVLDIEKDDYGVDIVAFPDGGKTTIVGNSKAPEWFAAIDQAIDKVERQLRKLKERAKDHRGKKGKTDWPASTKEDDDYEDE